MFWHLNRLKKTGRQINIWRRNASYSTIYYFAIKILERRILFSIPYKFLELNPDVHKTFKQQAFRASPDFYSMMSVKLVDISRIVFHRHCKRPGGIRELISSKLLPLPFIRQLCSRTSACFRAISPSLLVPLFLFNVIFIFPDSQTIQHLTLPRKKS